MNIKWFGQAAFRLESDSGLSVITDPYTPEILGYAPIADSADVVIVSSLNDQAHCRHDLVPGDHATVSAIDVAHTKTVPGGCPLSVSAVLAMEIADHPEHAPGQNAMYRYELDGISIGHMGDVGNPLSDEQIAFFQGTDLLLALAGGQLTIALDDLMVLVETVQPKIVVPMHFRTLTYRPRNTHWIQTFLDYFPDERVDFAFGSQARITKEALPDHTRVLVLDYAR